jgi:sugar/nucleoside kinase (ribokinase family)
VSGFLLGVLSGWHPRTAAVFGNAVASFNVTKVGATAGVPTYAAVSDYIKTQGIVLG